MSLPKHSLIVTAVIVFGLMLAHAMPSIGEEKPGKQAAFDQCAACHSVDGGNGTGPTLKGIFGRQSGTVPGFRYSRAMRNAAISWDEKSLDQYLINPQEFIAGNVMPFAGVPDAKERADIISYLKSLNQ